MIPKPGNGIDLSESKVAAESVHDPNMADVRRRIVDPKIITEFPNQLFSVLRGAGFDIHPQELASPNLCHLRVASFQYQIVVDRLSFRIPSQGLVFHDDLDDEA